MKKHFYPRIEIIKYLVICCLILVPISGLQAISSSQYSGQSVLSSGKWIKIKVSESGVYQLSFDLLKTWGFSDPKKVKIYGYGGAILSENFKTLYLDDLPQIPTYQPDNYRLLFYAQGPVSWAYANSSTGFIHERNPYSTAGYYFLTENDTEGLSMPIQQKGSTYTQEMSIFDDYTLHELELKNIGKSGRTFYGEDFRYSPSQDFSFNIPGITADSVNMQVDFVAKVSKERSQVKHYHNNTLLASRTEDIISVSNEYYENAKLSSSSKKWKRSPDGINTIRIEHTGRGHKIASLDFIRLNFKRELKLYDGEVRFRNTTALNRRIRYTIQTNNIQPVIWDISTHYLPEQIQATSENNITWFLPLNTGIKEYIAFDPTKTFPVPENAGSVANQNLHALPQTNMVIIVPSEFESQAERIANFHREKDALSVTIVNPEKIYNEFSSGTPDATAYRRFMKMFYDRAKGNDDKPRYLLLFGDGSFDNRLITKEWQSYNYPFLLTYQSKSGLDERSSYVSDDYFGFLDDEEGTKIDSDQIDIGIGRFPVRTIEEATAVTDKIIKYNQNINYGIWKNELCFLGDDGDKNLHMKQSDNLTKIIETSNPEFTITKIYLDAFKKNLFGEIGTYPDAKKKFLDLLESGTLMINYTGHGNSTGLTGEDILKINDIKQFKNTHLPLWVTATCDFCRFDDLSTSGGEELFLNPKGGGIALFTTTRVVYTDGNAAINTNFMNNIFNKQADGTPLRLGDIMKNSKRAFQTSDRNKLNFALIGDPAMQLAYPDFKIQITEINGIPVNKTTPILVKAQELTTAKGEILLPSGEKATQFNGFIVPRIFDSKTDMLTLDNAGTKSPFPYEDRTRLLYTGRDTVSNGTFSFTFRIPKENNYSENTGLINLYAHDTYGNEAQGICENFVIEKLQNTNTEDSTGPIINAIYLNDNTFNENDIVNDRPILIAEVADSSGINFSGNGVGHEITVIIDNSEKLQYTINQYFTPSDKEYGKGTICYPLPQLEEGLHTLTLKVWDTENNSTTESLSFILRSGATSTVYKLEPKENPVRENAQFYLQRESTINNVIKITLSISDLAGSEIWKKEVEGTPSEFSTSPLEWNIKNTEGERVPAGVYLYNAVISSGPTYESTTSKKIVVLAQ